MNVNILKHNLQSHQKAFVIFGNLIITFLLLSVITACSSGNEPAPASKATTAIPTQLQKLNADGGTLSAYVVIDGNEDNRIPMILNRQGVGAASVTIPSLSRSLHTLVITYEYTNENGTIILATSGQAVDLTAGSDTLNVGADDYDLDIYDKDNDSVNNAQELLDGRDPFIPEVFMEVRTATPALSAAAAATGTLRAFVSIDGDEDARIEMTINVLTGIASYTFPFVTQESHDIVVTFEYTDNTSTLVLSRANRTIDTTNGSVSFEANVNSTDFALFDEDNDEISNTNELLAGSNPRLSVLPVKAAIANLSYEQTKAFQFNWQDVPDATYYQLKERIDNGADYNIVSNRILSLSQTFSHIVPLYARLNTEYILQSCNRAGCIDGDVLTVDPISFVDSIGILNEDGAIVSAFGSLISLSGDGKTLAVSSFISDPVLPIGIIYIYTFTNNQWLQQASIEFNNVTFRGSKVELSQDANTLVISIPSDDSGTTGIALNRAMDNALTDSGAVYVYIRDGEAWALQAYIKADITGDGDRFGQSISLSGNGSVLAVGAILEDSNATSIGGDQNNNLSLDSGAVYVFKRNVTNWTQQTYIKGRGVIADEQFGFKVSLSGEGNTLAVGVPRKDSTSDFFDFGLGAVYIYELNSQNVWFEQVVLKPVVTGATDGFGYAVDLNFSGDTLVATAPNNAPNKSSGGVGIYGAAYVYQRDLTQNWREQAFLKLDVSESGNELTLGLGVSVHVNDDGNIIAITHSSGNDSTFETIGASEGRLIGSAYTYVLTGAQWIEQARIQTSSLLTPYGNSFTAPIEFGISTSLSGDGKTFVVGSAFVMLEGSSTIPKNFIEFY